MTSISQTEEELAALARQFSSPDAALIKVLLERLKSWRSDHSTVTTLDSDLAGMLKEVSFSTHQAYARTNLVIASLRDTVKAVPGMTVNERLFCFDLMDRWDQASKTEQLVLRNKLLASQ